VILAPDGQPLALAPVIHVPRKTRRHPSAEARSIHAAIQGARGIDVLAPVIHDGEVVAETFGVPWWICKRRPDLDPTTVFWRVPRERRLRYWCAMNTYDQIIAAISAGQEYDNNWSKAATTAGVAGNYYDLWPVGGNPQAGAYGGAALTSVQHSDAEAGCIYHMGNVSTSVKNIASVSGLSSAGTPTLWIYDRVLTYEACPFNNNVNTNFTNSLAAQRYISGGQQGLKVSVQAQTLLGATADTITLLTYVGQKGGAGKTIPVAFANSIIVSAVAPTINLGARVVFPSVSAATVPVAPFMPLAAGESGVQSLTNWTTANNTQTGTLVFVLMQPLAQIPLQAAGVYSLVDQVQQVASFNRVFDGACLALFAFFPAATGATLQGDINVVWG
jgi:hypothetical protein